MNTKPWEEEPDFLEFEANGFVCQIRRHPSLGILNGYMRVPVDHPWYPSMGTERYWHHYNQIEADVHGGLTFSNTFEECYMEQEIQDRHHYYIGFDCGHCGDYIPHSEYQIPHFSGGNGVYRDINYVRKNLISLTRQALDAYKH